MNIVSQLIRLIKERKLSEDEAFQIWREYTIALGEERWQESKQHILAQAKELGYLERQPPDVEE